MQEEKGEIGDEMVGWHHQLNGHELEQTQGDNEWQWSLACRSPWCTKSQTQQSDWTATGTTNPTASELLAMGSIFITSCPSGFHEHSCLKTATLGYDFWISFQALLQSLPLSVGSPSGGTSLSRLSSLLIWPHVTMGKQFQATNFYLTPRGRRTY